MMLDLNYFKFIRSDPRSQQLIPDLNNAIYHFAFTIVDYINIKILVTHDRSNHSTKPCYKPFYSSNIWVTWKHAGEPPCTMK